MRVAALYDIHGNLPALEAVLADVRRSGVDLVVVGGDVLPGPMPLDSLDLLLALDVPTRFISGNGEREVLASRDGVDTGNVPERYRAGIRWVADGLGAEREAGLRSWPPTTRLDLPGIGDVLFCHATPRSDLEIFTSVTAAEKLAPVFEGCAAQLVVCGHTHMQFDRRIGGVRVVNAGSVGMPFGVTGAEWLLLDGGVDLRHTDYDLGAAAARIRATSYPLADEFAEQNVLRPPSETTMLEAFRERELT